MLSTKVHELITTCYERQFNIEVTNMLNNIVGQFEIRP